MISEIASKYPMANGPRDDEVSAAIQRHPDFQTLRPHLSQQALSQLAKTTEGFYGAKIQSILVILMSEIDRIEGEWKVAPTQVSAPSGTAVGSVTVQPGAIVSFGQQGGQTAGTIINQFGAGAVFLLAAIVAVLVARRRLHKTAVTPVTAIDQKTHGSHSPAIAQGSGTQNIHIYSPTFPVPPVPHTPDPQSSTNTLPKVMAVRYGRAPDGQREGLYLDNDGTTAFEVQPEPLSIGQGAVTFAAIATLQKNAFSMAQIESCEGHGSFQLDPVWRKALDDQRVKALEIPLRIVYRNYEGQSFKCFCRLERDVNVKGDSPFVVTTLRQNR